MVTGIFIAHNNLAWAWPERCGGGGFLFRSLMSLISKIILLFLSHASFQNNSPPPHTLSSKMFLSLSFSSAPSFWDSITNNKECFDCFDVLAKFKNEGYMMTVTNIGFWS